MHRRALLTLPLLAASLVACAGTPPQASPEAETPTRAEVLEIERQARPAGQAAVAALHAYHRQVCAPRQGLSGPEEPQPRRRGCRFVSPVEELKLLQRLRDRTPAASPDLPRLVERMIANWIEMQQLVNEECAAFQLKPSPSTGDVEKAQQTLHVIDGLRSRAFTEPLTLCAELREQHPAYKIRVPCPPAEGPPAQAPTNGEWF